MSLREGDGFGDTYAVPFFSSGSCEVARMEKGGRFSGSEDPFLHALDFCVSPISVQADQIFGLRALRLIEGEAHEIGFQHYDYE